MTISELAQYALIKEATLSPKPGLVDSLNNGAHQDMNLDTFIRSALSLGKTFDAFYNLPQKVQVSSIPTSTAWYTHLFQQSRLIGIDGEANMRTVTKGVNTHKGAIFTFGLLLMALNILKTKHPNAPKEDWLTLWPKTVQALVQDTLPAEIEGLKFAPPESHGNQLLQTYGSLGPRGEALAGYPSIFRLALPFYRKIRQTTAITENEAWLRTLLYLMAHLEDSNVLHRAGQMGLEMVQANSRLLLEFTDSQDFYQLLERFDQRLIAHHISPGGAADLLAATIFVQAMLTSDCL